MRTSIKTPFMVNGLVALGAAIGFAGCGGSSGGGGGAGSTAAPVSPIDSSDGVGTINGLAVSPPGEVTVDAPSATSTGGKFQLVVDGYDRSNQAVDLTRDVTYTVENEQVARIDGNGLIEAVGPGTTEIAVSYQSPVGALRAVKTVTVVPAASGNTQPNYVELTVYPKSRVLFDVDAAAGVDQIQQTMVAATDDTGRVWDLTRSVAIEVKDFNDPSLKPLPISTAGALDPSGLFRGSVDGNEVLLAVRLDAYGLVSGAHIVIGDGRSKPVPPSALYSGAPLAGSSNEIDRAILSEISKNFVEPSGLSSDGEFLRRLYADAIGRLPTEAEYEAFVADQNPDKRDAEVDKLLASAEFADHWGSRIGEYFVIPNPAFDAWASTQIASGTTLKSIVSDLITGTGQGGQMFDAQHGDAADKVDILLKAGAGMTAECAKCHDHPVTGPNDDPRWVQDDRYPLDAFFATSDEEARKLDKLANRFGQPAQPGVDAIIPNATVTSALNDPVDQKRAEFAALFTESFVFERGLAHRIYADVQRELLDPNQFIAKELNAVKVPAVLDALATIFESEQGSLQGFLGQVFKSKAYQLTSADSDPTKIDFLARHGLERAHAEVCASLVQNVTGSAPSNMGFFRQTFGFPLDRLTIDERTTVVNMSQPLVLMNSPITQDALASGTGPVAALAQDVDAGTITVDDAVTTLFHRALQRDPSVDEMDCFKREIANAGSTAEGLQDAASALMSCIEAVSQ